MSNSFRRYGLQHRPGFPVPHHLPEFAHVHVHWVGDAIQPSHPLPPSSPPALSLSQHQGLFQWVSHSHQGARVLELQLQHQPFQWVVLSDWLWSPCCPRDSQDSSPHLESINSSGSLFIRAPLLWPNHRPKVYHLVHGGWVSTYEFWRVANTQFMTMIMLY